jgi:IS5 family transposase
LFLFWLCRTLEHEHATKGQSAQAVGGEAIEQLPQRLVKLVPERGVIQGRKMRVDTTVVETNIH